MFTSLLFLLQMDLACSAVGSKLPYKIIVYNYHNKGIYLTKFPVLDRFDKTLNHWWGVYPGLSSESPGTREFRSFIGYERQLPEGLTVQWQLANLPNCKVKRSSVYIWKESCKWEPIPDKVYNKTLDIAALAETAKQEGPTTPNCLLIQLIFRNDELQARAIKVHFGGVGPQTCFGSVAVGD